MNIYSTFQESQTQYIYSHGDGEESLDQWEHRGEEQGEGHGEDGGQGHGLGDDRQRRHRPQQQHGAPAQHTLYLSLLNLISVRHPVLF